ncbi:CRTAC1 family protein [Shewanella sp. Scap07]|uniref:CRTAC1 family protein n=1 Tax=Shewanella sp. Scap07 TaxID=2589987 RepID=UPI0015C0DCD1|nr:CRTAC1 family protein [Shewanella sp. Scap07]QLE86076.1 CRTAC1 family protein [Shewanella sp. Scap07]
MRLLNYGIGSAVSFTPKLKLKRLALSSLLIATFTNGALANTEFEFAPIDDGILKLMGQLETDKDPKCHATATRLEGLIYGTPLAEQARYSKTEYQKQLVKFIWTEAAKRYPQQDPLTKSSVSEATAQLFTTTLVNGSVPQWQVKLGQQQVIITERDQQHYGSIAYTLRAMLAVQQDVLLDFDLALPELSDEAANYITQQVDLVTLSLLKLADESARAEDQYEVSANHIDRSWLALFPDLDVSQDQQATSQIPVQNNTKRQSGLLMPLVEQKIAAFAQYNDVNQTLFIRNLQVYFAKLAMPESEQAKASFKQYFIEAMIAFSGTLYLNAQAYAQQTKGITIKEADVAAALHSVLPHDVNEYEDVIFYPKYAKDKQVIIESYDMDAFRDSGLHWVYFKEALNDANDMIKLEADPFAAELLSEAIAHYGVLLLREAGTIGKANQQQHLSAELVAQSYQQIDSNITAHTKYQPDESLQATIVSADNSKTKDKGDVQFFENVSVQQNFEVEHRSSDWLSRQLRSYLEKDVDTGIITIPPAFGGSGIAAEDINGDGLTDLLVLSGLGNKLFFNTGKGLVDVTKESGLVNVSRRQGSSNSAGEPRQPLIADWDNDGDQDIIITYVDELHHVYRNDGTGKFEDISTATNLGGIGAVGGPATTVDVNNDGLLDVYIQYFGNYLKGDLPTLKRRNDNGGENVLFINKGNFKFEQADKALGANNNGWGQAVTHADLNMDGWQDLIVGNDFGVNAYYINQQGKGFRDYAANIGTNKPSYTMNLSLSDLNRDGIADVYVSNIVTMNKDQKYVLPSEDTTAEFNPDKLANMRVVEGNDLFLSAKNEKGALKYQHSDSVGRGYSTTGWAWDADFFDVDNDGDDDLYVLNGMNDYYVYSKKNPYYTDPMSGESVSVDFPDAAKASNVFFINSNGKLNNVSALSGLDFIGNSRAATYLDLDSDGDLDVAVNNYHDTAQLFANQAQKLSNNWLKITLEGSPQNGVNRDAIGAQIIVTTASDGYTWRQVNGSQGYMSVHPKEQHIGLGKAHQAKVSIIWPNGKRQHFDNVDANQSYMISYPK